MAFMLSEDEKTPYGTDVLTRIRPAGTVREITQAVERLDRSAGGRAFVWIMGERRPVGFVSVTAGADGLTFAATPEGRMPPPVPAPQFVAGVRTEAAGNEDARVFVKFDGGVVRQIDSARLELLDSEDPLYVITLEPGSEVKIKAARDASVDAPRNSDDVQRCLRRLAGASGRVNLAKEPLFCHIPSVPSKYAGDEELAGEIGTTCVVDTVTKKNQHLEIDLMSVSPAEAEHMQLDPGEQSAEAVASKCAGLGAGLPLFFMYKGVPYAASDFSTENGTPPTLTLEPWADVDEDADEDAEEIRMLAADQAANGIL